MLMKKYLSDLAAVLKGDGIALDDAEAAALGAPNGETISLWVAMAARHGNAIAHLMCLALWLVQFRHCRDELAGVPMAPSNYVRAAILLIIFAPLVFAIGAVRKVVHGL